jgi:hypothetical protein
VAKGTRPVYWRPGYPTRVMRERAFAKRQLEREAVLRASAGPTLFARLAAMLGRRR